MKTARITLEFSGETLDNLLYIAQRRERHPNELIVDLLSSAIESSIDGDKEQNALLNISSQGLLH